MNHVKKPWRKPKRGPIPPAGGRIRITINLPRQLLRTLNQIPGRSRSAKLVALVEAFKENNG